MRLWEQGHHCNGIYRGQKSDAWDGGHRVPFIARWPGRIPAGTRCDRVLCLTDLFATCGRLAGASWGADAGEDSLDLRPLLLDAEPPQLRDDLIHHSIDGSFALRRGRWKLVACPGSWGWSAPNRHQPVEVPQVQLYDMDGDPAETRNLQAELPALTAELLTLLEQRRREPRSVP